MRPRLISVLRRRSPQSGVFWTLSLSVTLVCALWLVCFGPIFAAIPEDTSNLGTVAVRAAQLPQRPQMPGSENGPVGQATRIVALQSAAAGAPQEDRRAAAEKAFQEGQQLRAQGTAESLRKAIEKYQEAFQLWHDVGDGKQEANALNSTGKVYADLGETQKALDYYNQALRLFRAVGDDDGEAASLNNIGSLYDSLGEKQKALDYYNQALPLFRAERYRAGEAATLSNIGKVYADLGETQKALDFFKQALVIQHSVGDRDGEATTLNNIGSVYDSLGEKQKALDYYNQALPLFRVVGNRAVEATTLNNIGGVYDSLGEKQKALDSYDQALRMHRSVGNRAGEAVTLTNIGGVYDSLGATQKALDYYNQALPLFRVVGDRAGEATTLNNIGSVYGSLGEKQKALDYCNQALPLVRAVGDRTGEATTLSNIGKVYWDLGEKQKALDYYNQALPLFRAVRYRVGEAMVMNNIGAAYRDLGEKQKALDSYNQALPLLRAVRYRVGEAMVMNNIGEIYRNLGEKQKAVDYFNQARALHRAVGDRAGEATTLNNIGRVYFDLGETQKALDYCNQALPLFRAVGDRAQEATILGNSAFLERDRGRLQEARTQIEAALPIFESLRTKIAGEGLRASYFATVSGYYEFYVDLLMRLHRIHPSEGYDRLALEASERGRARSLLDLLSEAGAHIRQGIDPVLLAREQVIQQRLNAQAELKRKVLSGQHTLQQAAELDQQLRSLSSEYEQVEAEIREKSPHYAALQQPRPVSVKEMQQEVLDSDTLLLEYALGQDRSYLWAVTPTTISSYELAKRVEIENAALQAYNLLTARIRRWAEADREYEQAAASLSEMLLGPVASQLGGKRLVIVADGALNYIPFGALPVPAGRKTGSEETVRYKPLVVEHEVINLPSASVLAVLRHETAGRKQAPQLLAVLADPVFSQDDERVKASSLTSARTSTAEARTQAQARSGSSPQLGEIQLARSAQESGVTRSGESLPRLKATRQEAEAILSFVAPEQSKEVLDFSANRATATSTELAQYRYVHFATHGLLDSQHPELSGVVLSLVDERGEQVDGFLRLHDIFNLNLPAELVVLSACETGLGKEIQGEGLVGLTRGFMYAGSPRVVVSLWKVDDVATAELMTRFYQQILQKGLRPAAALRAARVAMWNEATWHAPYFWAAFVLQGEWR